MPCSTVNSAEPKIATLTTGPMACPAAAIARATEVSSWSPDGAKIAYESNRNGNWEIYLVNGSRSCQSSLGGLYVSMR